MDRNGANAAFLVQAQLSAGGIADRWTRHIVGGVENAASQSSVETRPNPPVALLGA